MCSGCVTGFTGIKLFVVIYWKNGFWTLDLLVTKAVYLGFIFIEFDIVSF